jgi:Ca2+-binding RTX toxin-like protein
MVWVLCALIPASALAAGSVSTSGTFMPFLVYTGDEGVNVVALSGSGGSVAVSETGISIKNATDCTDSGDRVDCTNIQRISATLLGGDDFLTNDHVWSGVSADGGEGADTLIGSDSAQASIFGRDSLIGGAGPDRVDGRGGDDDAVGGAGHDVVDGGAGADLVFGDFIGVLAGDGTDQVNGGPDDDTLAGNGGENDSVIGGAGRDSLLTEEGDGAGDVQDGGSGFDQSSYRLSLLRPGTEAFKVDLAASTATRRDGSEQDTLVSIEDVAGSEGNDILIGTAGSNVLIGRDGNDTLDGGLGADSLDGATGDDLIQARDGVQDRVLCGGDNDNAELDQLDEQSDCEIAVVAFVPPFGTTPPVAPDTAPPDCVMRGLARVIKVRRFFRGFGFVVECNEVSGLEVRLLVSVRRVRRGRLVTSRVGDLTLAERGAAPATGPHRVRLSPRRALRRALGRRFKARLRVVATDASGNRQTLRKTIRVRRAVLQRSP